MSWKVFAGASAEILSSLLLLRAVDDGAGLRPDSLAAYFRSHLERGIAKIQNVKDLGDLFGKIQSGISTD
jgi:DNA sulfur modification protein DndE